MEDHVRGLCDSSGSQSRGIWTQQCVRDSMHMLCVGTCVPQYEQVHTRGHLPAEGIGMVVITWEVAAGC